MTISKTFQVQLAIFFMGLIWLYIYSTGLFVASLEPGYLDFDNLPDTNFSCVGKVIGGYYADLETNCQMFHVCTIGQLDEPMDIRFLCLNGTVFDQETRVCERIDEVDCSKSEKFYSLNLELYGNTAPPILEESSETESPLFEKTASSTTTTTTTTTTTRPTTTTNARTEYFTSSIRPVTPSPYHKGPSIHQFSLEQPPNYTPEEINISLNPGAPPNIRTKAFEFSQQNGYSDNIDNSNQKIVTSPSSVFKSGNNYENSGDNSRISSSTTESDRNSLNPNLRNSQSSQHNFKYNFNYHDTRPRDFNPPRSNNYQYHHNFANFRPPLLSSNTYHGNLYRSSTQRNEYLPVSRKNFEVVHPSSTSRSFFLQQIKSQSQQYFRTEKPEGNQLPVLPTISPIVFSSPAPFALNQHVETKRYTDEHELPPRIIISASASVSDASGRTLNYSLGTIGAAKILAQPPASYDDYKEEDVVLDPFYHDVPKIQNNGKRTKRDTSGNGKNNGQSDISTEKILGSISKRSKRTPQNIEPSDIIKSEEEAVEVLKFLFDWYKKQEKSTKSPINIPVNPELISNINEQLSYRSYVPEDYEDDHTGTLEKSVILEKKHEEMDSPNYPPRTNSFGNSLLQQASRRPSSNINGERNVGLDQRYNPIRSNYEENNKYEGKAVDYFNDYNNQPTPPNYKLVQSSGPKSRSKDRPNRGRHRFTFPYATTPSQKRYTNEKQSDSRKTRVPNSSSSSYEEFDEQHTKNNDNTKNSYSVHNDKEFSVSQFDRSNTAFPDRGQNFEHNSQFNTHTNAVSSTQEPVLQKLDKVHEHRSVIVTGRSTEKEEMHNHSTTQNLRGSLMYSASTDNPLEDYSVSTDNIIRTSNTLENSGVLVTKTPDYTDYENEVELNKDEAQTTLSEINQASTDPYIDTYEYADDNYEPAIYNQNSEEKERLDKNNKDVIRGIIHEETHVNIDLTETPEEATYNYANQTEFLGDTTAYNSNSSSTELNITEQSSSTNMSTDQDNTNKFKFVDRNVTSFADILDSLRNFQKYEQDIYNYQNNLTEIKQYKAENSLTTREELTTSIPSSNWESTTSNDLYFTQVSNYKAKNSQRTEDDGNVPINTTGQQDTDNILNETDEESASSTRYITVATESSETKDEPQLFTSKPISLESSNDENFGESKEYVISKTEFSGTTPVSIDQTTSTQDDKIIYSMNETNSSATQSYEIADVKTEFVNHSFEMESNLDTHQESIKATTTQIEDPIEFTTVSSVPVELEEEGDEFVSSSSKARGRNRSRHRPSDAKKRVENMPVSNTYRETTGRRRNYRRRQQNKPFYNLEPITETQLFISTTPLPRSDNINISEISTVSDSVTENIINNSTFIPEYVKARSFYESLPSTYTVDSTPRGFYITKSKEETEYAQANPFSTEYMVMPQTTVLGAESNSTQHTSSPQSTMHYSDTSTDSEFTVEATTATELPTFSSNISDRNTASETTENILLIDEYTNRMSTNSTEENTQTTLSDSFNNLSTESSSNASTNLSELYSGSYIESTNLPAPTEEDSFVIPKFTTDISRMETTTDATRLNTFVSTSAPSTFTYSTLNISEIEVTTNSMIASQSTNRYNYEENYLKDDENLANIEENGISTELIQDSSFHTAEVTTEYPSKTTTLEEVENIDHTTQAYSSAEIEAMVSNTQISTRAPSTKINIITEVNLAEHSTHSNENSVKKKSSSENGINIRENKLEAQTNRDGRKYDRKTQNSRTKTSRNRFSPRHRFSSISVTPRTSGFGKSNISYKHRFDSVPDVTQKITTTSTEVEKIVDVHEPESPKIEEESLTEIYLPKNVKPTLATIKNKGFSTTPMLYKVELRKEKVNKHYVFNCFGKSLNQFYSDPRDCRLFHYCTNGYSKNQLLDMKFVCDLGTHFDDEKLVCTREIPKRCL